MTDTLRDFESPPPPIDEMRTEAKPEPSVDDAPVVTRT